MQTVAYFGPHGTFAEEALLTQPDLAACKRVPRSVPDVITAVEHGEVDVGPRADRELDRGLGLGHPRHARVRHRAARAARGRPAGVAEPVRQAGHQARRHHAPWSRTRNPLGQCRGCGWRRSCPTADSRSPPTPPPRPRRRWRSRSAPAWRRSATRRRAEMHGLERAGQRDRGPPREPDPLRARRARHPGADRPRQDVDRVLPARGPAGLAARDPPGVRGARDQPHQARVAADEARASATTASSSTSRATSTTSSSPTACATSRRSRPR